MNLRYHIDVYCTLLFSFLSTCAYLLRHMSALYVKQNIAVVNMAEGWRLVITATAREPRIEMYSKNMTK
jgi:hypothetical protein